MEVTVAQRIKMYIDDNQISLNALAKTLNMNQSTVLRQVKGEQTLSANLVESFLNAYPDVSAEWVMRGVGSYHLCKSAELIEDSIKVDYAAEPSPKHRDVMGTKQEESLWKAKYEELEKRYDQLLSILGGGMRQSKVNVG